MTNQDSNFKVQKLVVTNNRWTIELWFESIYADEKVIHSSNYSKTIDLSDSGYSGSKLAIKATGMHGETWCLITGIDGGSYLHAADEKDKSQTVKILNDSLVLSLGFTFFSFNLNKQEIEWKLRPDVGEVFEFYDLQDDYLVRGELEIHRIDTNGNISWSYGGGDIWVNIDGKKEVSIEDNKITLTDFAGSVYTIDFKGQMLEYIPVNGINEKKKKWWQIWK